MRSVAAARPSPSVSSFPARILFLSALFLGAAASAPLLFAKDFAWSQKNLRAGQVSRRGLRAGAINGKLYVVGGASAATPVDTVEEYDPGADAWSAKTPLLSAKTEFGVAVIGNKLYVVGGDPLANPSLQMYDPLADAWTSKANMITPRKYLAVCTVNNKIYAFGGSTSGGVTNLVEVYSPDIDGWSPKANLPVPRAHATACAYGNRIFLFGGEAVTDGYVYNVDEYDTVADTWTTRSFLDARNDAVALTLEDKIYLFGGRKNANTLSTVEEYDPSQDRFTAKISLPAPRAQHAVAAVDNKVYVIEGGKSAVDEADSLVYRGILTGVPALSATGEPHYTTDGLHPETGDSQTVFLFRIKYTDDDNEPPIAGYPRLHLRKGGAEIPGSPFSMTAANSADGVYTDGKIYSHALSGLTVGADYAHFFEAYDLNGSTAVGMLTTATAAPEVPEGITTRPPLQTDFHSTLYNNVFNPRQGGSCTIVFSVPQPGNVRLRLYDLLGREVRTLLDQPEPAGDFQKIWDGRNADNSFVPPGLYLLHYDYPGGREVRKIAVKG